MPKITKSFSVKAAPAKVLEYISNVANHPAFLSALRSVENVRGQSQKVGSTWEWTFTMAGIQLRGNAETVECIPDKLFSFKTTSGIESTFRYSAEAEQGGSRMKLEVIYEVPQNVLSKVLDRAVVERMNEAEADRTAQNLTAIFGS